MPSIPTTTQSSAVDRCFDEHALAPDLYGYADSETYPLYWRLILLPACTARWPCEALLTPTLTQRCLTFAKRRWYSRRFL